MKRFVEGEDRAQGVLLPEFLNNHQLRSYGAAKRKIMPDVEHRSHKGSHGDAQPEFVADLEAAKAELAAARAKGLPQIDCKFEAAAIAETPPQGP